MKHLLLGIGILFLFQNCKKEKTTDAQFQVSFSVNALDYVRLVEGKYLIYKDSATALTDSVIVTRSVLTNIYYPENNSGYIYIPAHYGEKFFLGLTTMANNGASSKWFEGAATALYNFPYLNTDTAEVSLSGGESNIESTVFSLTHSQHSNETVVIEGKTYNNVVIYINDNGLDINNPNYRKTIYYWAKGVAIIKRTIITTGGSVKTYTLLKNN